MADRDPDIGSRANYPAYGEDYAAWLGAQIQLLGDRQFDQLDLDNLIDEVGSLGRSDFNAFVSAIRIVLMHMLKWDIQTDHRTRSWANSIEGHRDRVVQDLEDSPSYKSRINEAVRKAYRQARYEAAGETRLPLARFPKDCPFTFDDIMTREHHLRDVPPDEVPRGDQDL